MKNNLIFVGWFILSNIIFLSIIMLIAVYGFDLRVGLEMQRYSADFAVYMLSIFIALSVVIVGFGFFIGVIVSKCSQEMWMAVLLGIICGILTLLSIAVIHFLSVYFYVHSLDMYSYIVIWGFGGFLLPFFRGRFGK